MNTGKTATIMPLPTATARSRMTSSGLMKRTIVGPITYDQHEMRRCEMQVWGEAREVQVGGETRETLA